MKKILLGIGVLLAIVVLAAGYIALTFDSNDYKDRVAAALSKSLNRTVTFKGDTHLSFFPALTLTANNVEIANPDWAGKEPMARIENLALKLAWVPLLQKRIKISGIVIKDAAVHFISKKDQQNWVFAADASTDTKAAQPQASHQPVMIDIADVAIENAIIAWQKDGDTTTLQLDKATIGAARAAPLTLTAQGIYLQQAFKIDVTGGLVAALFANDKNWPLQADIQLGDNKLTAQGSINEPVQLTAVDMTITANGTGTALNNAFKTSLPLSKDYKFSTQATLKNRAILTLKNYYFEIGATKAAGDLAIELAAKPLVKGTVNFAPLDLADFKTVPSSAVADTAVPQTAAPHTAQKSDQTDNSLIPAIELPTAALKTANANLKITVAPLVNGTDKIGSIETMAALKDGTLALNPFHIIYNNYIAEGSLAVTARPDGLAAVNTDLRMNKFDYGAWFKALKLGAQATGTADIALQFNGVGRTLRDIVTHSNGSMTAVGSSGSFDTGALLGVVGNVALASIAPGITLPTRTDIRCGYLDFRGVDGIWQTTQSAINSSNLSFTMRGNVNLASETIAMVLYPHLKDSKFKGLLPAVKISGPLLAPTFAPDKSTLAQTAASAVDVLGGSKLPGALLQILNGGKLKAAGADVVPTNACLASVLNDLRDTEPKATTPAADNSDIAIVPKADQLQKRLNKGLLKLFGQ